MTSKVAKLQRACLKDPVKVEADAKYQTVSTLRQQFLFIPFKFKVGAPGCVGCGLGSGHVTQPAISAGAVPVLSAAREVLRRCSPACWEAYGCCSLLSVCASVRVPADLGNWTATGRQLDQMACRLPDQGQVQAAVRHRLALLKH